MTATGRSAERALVQNDGVPVHQSIAGPVNLRLAKNVW
jgi:hypothetical protein